MFAVFLEAVLRVGRRAMKSKLAVVIAAAAFVALFFFAVPFPLVVAAAAIIGFAADRLGYAMGGHAAHGKDDALLGEHIPDHARPSNQARDFLYNAINSPQARSAPALL